MGIGTAEEVLRLSVSSPVALARVKAALSAIGKVQEADDARLFVRGSTRYGLQKVRLKCQVLSDGDASRVVIKALADDLWGKGARQGIEKFKIAILGGA